MPITINARQNNKKDTLANWLKTNPILINGELVFVELEDGTIKHKVGNGIAKFSELPYESDYDDKADKIELEELKTKSIQHNSVTGYPITITDQLPDEKFIKCNIYGNTDGVGDSASGKYKIPVAIRGLNLFNFGSDSSSWYVNSSAVSTTVIDVDNRTIKGNQGSGSSNHAINSNKIYVTNGKQYTVSCNNTYTTSKMLVQLYDKNGAVLTTGLSYGTYNTYYKSYVGVTTTNEYTFTINNSNVDYILVGVVFCSGTEGTASTYSNIQCRLSSTPVVTLNTPLTAGEYIDIVNKKRYNGDTVTDITISNDLKTLDSEENTIFCNTAISPSKIELSYWQNIDRMKTNNATIVNNNTDTSVVIDMAADHEYRYFIALTDLTMKLPETPVNNYISSIVFKTNKDSFTFTAPDNCRFIGDDCDNGTFTPLKNSKYDVVVVYDGEEYIGYVGCRTTTSSQNGKLYTAGNGISISDSNEVSVKVVDGSGLSVDSNGINLDISDKLSNKADKQTIYGGFAAGNSAQVSQNCKGAAIGHDAYTDNGGSVGDSTHSNNGGSVGNRAYTENGGAIGENAQTSNGFAGGYNAKAFSDDDGYIDAVQLGTGTNSNEYTAQIYDYQLLANDASAKSSTDGSKYLKDVGKLSDLTTASKTDIVSAINEVKTTVTESSTKIIYGTYTGNGDNVRTINIGVTPTMVYIQPTMNPTYNSKIYYGGLALAGVPYRYTNDTRFVIQCVENGFKVCEASDNGTYTWSCSTNTNNLTYSFVAIVGGEQKNIT